MQPNGGFNGIEYSASTARFFNDKNNEPTADWHPLIDEVVYYGTSATNLLHVSTTAVGSHTS
jgi:hypothetical protein